MSTKVNSKLQTQCFLDTLLVISVIRVFMMMRACRRVHTLYVVIWYQKFQELLHLRDLNILAIALIYYLLLVTDNFLFTVIYYLLQYNNILYNVNTVACSSYCHLLRYSEIAYVKFIVDEIFKIQKKSIFHNRFDMQSHRFFDFTGTR